MIFYDYSKVTTVKQDSKFCFFLSSFFSLFFSLTSKSRTAKRFGFLLFSQAFGLEYSPQHPISFYGGAATQLMV